MGNSPVLLHYCIFFIQKQPLTFLCCFLAINNSTYNSKRKVLYAELVSDLPSPRIRWPWISLSAKCPQLSSLYEMFSIGRTEIEISGNSGFEAQAPCWYCAYQLVSCPGIHIASLYQCLSLFHTPQRYEKRRRATVAPRCVGQCEIGLRD